jgi:hypothetical protein
MTKLFFHKIAKENGACDVRSNVQLSLIDNVYSCNSLTTYSIHNDLTTLIINIVGFFQRIDSNPQTTSINLGITISSVVLQICHRSCSFLVCENL